MAVHAKRSIAELWMSNERTELCLYYTSIQHLFDLAELARERGLRIEAGPGRHGIGGAPFLFMFEPGGNRIEVIGDPGYMIFDPAWRTVVWSADDLDVAAAWTGAPMPPSFWEIGTPGTGAVVEVSNSSESASLEVEK